ncbi:MAG TPA: CoA transferase [Desulfobulbaceae bacterium]|nr:CoA transferase [Desulfobulbaceae bacterium]
MKDWKQVERVATPAIVPQFGPLSGVRVLLTGSVVAGPVAATLLAEFGAEVIHVEMPGVGDTLRGQSPVLTHGDGVPFMVSPSEVPQDQKISSAWMQEGRNKLSVTLKMDMKQPEAKDIFFGLIKNCDIWIENMVWLDKLGIYDADVLAANPKIVIAHVSGFGRPQFGGVPEDCDRGSYDPIGQCEGGWMYSNGFPDGPPVYGSSFMNDYLSAFICANGVLMAYINAQKTGKGQVVDVAQVECMSRMMCDSFVNMFTIGLNKERAGNKIPIFQPADLFKTKDGYLYVGTFGKAVYERCLNAMGISTEKFPYLEAGASREAINSPLGKELDREVNKWMMAHTSEEGLAVMKKAKIPSAIPRTIKQLTESEHYKSRGNFVTYKDETLGKEITGLAPVPKMSETKGMVWRGAPKLGQDTETVLKTILGYSDADIAGIRGKGVIDRVKK